MSLETGTKLGAFEILAPLGAGGMGEVYKAKDTRLERLVAIKVLPSHLADNADLKKRFEQEARAISSLNHPNICTLYDIGHDDGTDFIVMELLEGESLADRLKNGPLPLEEALRTGAQMAEALDRAHRDGIVHRDLKPGNVMLTPSGAKLLDFGLAKLAALGTNDAASSLSAFPTEAKSLTAEGTILGTFQYMAPEQLEGETVDARTDIFALGALLYEMITGRKAFEGKSQASLIGAIMTSHPPPVSHVRETAPPALDHVIRTCLAKNPEDRWQSARDVVRGLQWVGEAGALPEALPRATAERARNERWKTAVIAGLAAALAALATWTVFRPGDPDPRLVRRTLIELPGETTFDGLRPSVALSPDGSHLVFPLQTENSRRLYLRPLDQLEATPIAGTEGARNPFFSPDGEWVAFFTRSAGKATLKRVSIHGGPAVSLADVLGNSGSWDADDWLIVEHDDGGGFLKRGLFRVPAGGGPPERLTTPDPERGELFHAWPHVLPRGKGVVFSIPLDRGRFEESRIALLSLETGEWHTLIEQGYNARYAASGHLVYALSGTLMAVPFDLDRLAITGSTVPVLENVAGSVMSGNIAFDVAGDGSLVYAPGSTSGRRGRTLVWVDRDGREEALSAEPRGYVYPRISPDGTRVALDVRDDVNDIWTWDLRRETLTRLTFASGAGNYPVWTPDGSKIVYVDEDAGARAMYWKSADGTGTAEKLGDGRSPYSISPDGKSLVFRKLETEDLDVLSLEGDYATEPLVSRDFTERNGEIDPTGRWLAYESDESGQFEIYVHPFPNTDSGRWQISQNGGTRPAWSRDGRELFFLNLANELMASPIEPGDTFSHGTPVPLFDKAYYVGPPGRPYDVAPDGQRFLMIQRLELDDDTPAQTSLVHVLNWFEELKERAPAR